MAERKVWTQKEDDILKMLVEGKGIKKWSQICKILTSQYRILHRNGKQCRQRYLNHLATGLKKGDWTQQEDELLIQLHNKYGNRWAQISHYFKGRTDNCVKNQLYSRLRKSLRHINDTIERNFRKKYKALKINFIYKLIEMTDEKYKSNPIIKKEAIDQSYQLKNRIISLQCSQNEQNVDIICELIKAINGFNKKYKKRLPKRKNHGRTQESDLQQECQQDQEQQQQMSVAKNEEQKQEINRNQIVVPKKQQQFLATNIKINYSNAYGFQPDYQRLQASNSISALSDKNSLSSRNVLKKLSGDSSLDHSSQFGRLHSLSIQKQAGFQLIVEEDQNNQQKMDIFKELTKNQKSLFNRVDPTVHGQKMQSKVRVKRSSSGEQIPNIIINGQCGSAFNADAIKTSRLRSFGSIEASYDLKNNSTPKVSSFEKSFLNKDEVDNWLNNIQ